MIKEVIFASSMVSFEAPIQLQNGEVRKISCVKDECIIEESFVREDDLFMLSSTKKAPIPIPANTPSVIKNTLQRAIDTAGAVDRLEVKVSYGGQLYEYKYERSGGWHSFRVKKDKFYREKMPGEGSQD